MSKKYTLLLSLFFVIIVLCIILFIFINNMGDTESIPIVDNKDAFDDKIIITRPSIDEDTNEFFDIDTELPNFFFNNDKEYFTDEKDTVQILDHVPQLYIIYGENRYGANYILNGSNNWRSDYGGNTLPLVVKSFPTDYISQEYIKPIIIDNNLENVAIKFEGNCKPDVIVLEYWDIADFGKSYSMSKGYFLHSRDYVFTIDKAGGIFKLNAIWNSSEEYSGSAEYLFYFVNNNGVFMDKDNNIYHNNFLVLSLKSGCTVSDIQYILDIYNLKLYSDLSDEGYIVVELSNIIQNEREFNYCVNSLMIYDEIDSVVGDRLFLHSSL